MKKLFASLLVSLLSTLPISCEEVLSSSENEIIEDNSNDFSSSTIINNEIVSIELVCSDFYSLSSSNKLQLKVHYADGTNQIVEVSEDMIDGNINLNEVGQYSIQITYEKITSSFIVNVLECKRITLDSSDSISGISQYSTGNYVSYIESGETFQFYRAHRNQSSTLTSIFPKETYVNVDSLSGAIYNKTCIDGILGFDIEYKSLDGLSLLVGKNKNEMEEILLPSHDSFKKYSVSIDNMNFFSIETIENTAIIKSIDIYYTDVSNGGIEEYNRCNEGIYRLNPVTYEAALEAGVSYVDVPIDISVTGDSYTINATKRYTYYTYDYVKNNLSIASDAALVDPMDVANYFIAFKTYPCNYVDKKSYSAAYSIFKDKTRCVSDYSRTNGYATAVPYKANSSGKPHYYECDIALTSAYSSSNRGVGRLVVWEYGFTSNGYDDSIVAVYTDDHYASFAEYLNNGKWGQRFNAEFNRTGYRYGSAITLN